MPQVKLTRPQIAAFVKDPRAARELENLFTTVSELSTTGVDTVAIAASNAQATAEQAVGLALQVAQDATINATAADAKATEALGALNRLADAVALLALAPPRVDARRARYGSFYDTSTQTAAVANTAYPMTFNTTDLTMGVHIGAPSSRVYVDTSTIYNIQFSAQIDRTSATDGIVWIWLRANGTDVTDSAGQIRIKGNNAETIAAWNYVAKLNAGDYFEIVWAADDTASRIQAFAASGVVPGIPSVILTVTDNISA